MAVPYTSRTRGPLGWSLLLSTLVHGVCLLLLLLWVTAPHVKPPEPPVAHKLKFLKSTLPQRRPLLRPRAPEKIIRPLVRRPAFRTSVVSPVAVSVGPTRQGRLEGVASPRLGSAGAGLGLPGLPPGPGGGGGSGLSPLLSSRGRGPSPAIGPGIPGGTGGGGGVEGTRAGANEIDLGLELLDVKALDTGRHRALVITDPKEKKKLKGFLCLSNVHSEAIERAELDNPLPRRLNNVRPQGITLRQVAEQQSLQGLADKMSEQTQVKTQVLDGLALDDPRLLQVPFVLLTVNASFTCTEVEARNLGRYLISGGFLYAENVYWPRSVGNDFTSDQPALRALIRTAFQQVGYQEGKGWKFVRLPQSHPLYHCYYDLDTLPLGFHDWTYTGRTAQHFSPEYLEGIQVGNRLAGLYSQKDYADFWAGEAEYIRTHTVIANDWFTIGGEELPVYRLGINVLVYALTQEGSLAQKLVSVE